MMALAKGRARSHSAIQRSLSSPFPEGTHEKLDHDSITSLRNTEVNPHRQGLPAWDRTFDAVYHKHAGDQNTTNNAARFPDAIQQFFKDHGHKRPSSGYFRLPDSVRMRICQFVLAPHRAEKPIRLNRSSFNRDCWRTDDLQSPSTALLPLGSYLEVSFGFRADFLVAFLLEVRLHATFSPYVGPRVSPLATTWLNRYGKYAQEIVVEIDMTRLNCGAEIYAVGLLPGVEHIDALLHKFVEHQLCRKKTRPLNSLVLLCRRFYGLRYQDQPTGFEKALSSSPVRRRPFWNIDSDEAANSSTEGTDGTETPDPRQTGNKTPTSPFLPGHQVYYCPDSYLDICDRLLALRGRINSVRICGFSEEYATRFVDAMFPSAPRDLRQHCYRVAPSTIWPRLSGQKSYIDMGNRALLLDDHDTVAATSSNAAVAAWEGCVQLPPPVIDASGTPSLPPVVRALQRMRSQSLESSVDSQTQGEQSRANGALEEVGVEKTRIMRLLDVYGKAKAKRKRSLSKEISATL